MRAIVLGSGVVGVTSAYYLARSGLRMVRLAEYSRDCLKTLRVETGITYEGRMSGTLQVFRTEAQLEAPRCSPFVWSAKKD